MIFLVIAKPAQEEQEMRVSVSFVSWFEFGRFLGRFVAVQDVFERYARISPRIKLGSDPR